MRTAHLHRVTRHGTLPGLLLTSVLLGASLGLGACSSVDATSLGHEACRDVARSLQEFERANSEAPAAAARDRAAALVELGNAMSPAALAASADGSWQALEATLSESSRVPEAELTTALSAQCSQSLSTT